MEDFPGHCSVRKSTKVISPNLCRTSGEKHEAHCSEILKMTFSWVWLCMSVISHSGRWVRRIEFEAKPGLYSRPCFNKKSFSS
jgi:hypothetical protein